MRLQPLIGQVKHTCQTGQLTTDQAVLRQEAGTGDIGPGVGVPDGIG